MNVHKSTFDIAHCLLREASLQVFSLEYGKERTGMPPLLEPEKTAR